MILAGVTYGAVLPEFPMFRLEEGKKVPHVLRSETKYVAFYQSASWCPPCRKTTPPLIEEYQRMLEMDDLPVEIILWSGDRSEEDMLGYMKRYEMPWPALEWGSRSVAEKYLAEGIPHLVLVELETGKVITKGTGPEGVEAAVERMREYSGVSSDKSFRIEGFLDKYGLLIMVALSCVVILVFQKWRGQKQAA